MAAHICGVREEREGRAIDAILHGSPEWHEERKTYLGATDIAAICGLSKYASPLQVWLAKTGRAEQGAESIAAARGKALEPLILSVYETVECCQLRRNVPVVRHPEFPFIGCNADGMWLDRPRGVEAKSYGNSVAKEWGQDGTDQVPASHWTQAQINSWLFGLVFGGKWNWDVIGWHMGYDTWTIHPIPPRPDVCEALIEKAVRFWHDYILADVQPAVTGQECDEEWLNKTYRKAVVGEIAIADSKVDQAALAYIEMGKIISPAEKKKKAAANVIKDTLKDAEAVETAHGRFAWTNNADTVETDWGKVVEGVRIYAPLLGGLHEDAPDLLIKEIVRLTDEFTTIKTGTRKIVAPRGN